MLSSEEKREMLEDSKSQVRRKNFGFARDKNLSFDSFDDYLSFLQSVQKVFSPFKSSRRHTITKYNKL